MKGKKDDEGEWMNENFIIYHPTEIKKIQTPGSCTGTEEEEEERD
jgi:hypothetical protein